MSDIVVEIDGTVFPARFEERLAPRTVAAFRAILPYEQRLIHVRWSGEACWIPLGDRDFGLGFENATRHPAPGQVLLYPGGISETEILIAYGAVAFASKAGPLAGNHFLTITERLDDLAAIGRETLWSGAKAIVFREAGMEARVPRAVSTRTIVVTIPTAEIGDWDSFHAVFKAVMGFPDFYGANMNAWIDCMTYVADPAGFGMTAVRLAPGELLTFRLDDAANFRKRCPEQYEALVRCVAFVNYRHLERGDPPVLTLMPSGWFGRPGG